FEAHGSDATRLVGVVDHEQVGAGAAAATDRLHTVGGPRVLRRHPGALEDACEVRGQAGLVEPGGEVVRRTLAVAVDGDGGAPGGDHGMCVVGVGGHDVGAAQVDDLGPVTGARAVGEGEHGPAAQRNVLLDVDAQHPGEGAAVAAG